MVNARFGVGLDRYGTRPDLLRANTSMIDGRLAKHAGGLGSVWIELVAFDDSDAVMFPAKSIFLSRARRMRVLAHFSPPMRHPAARCRQQNGHQPPMHGQL